LFSWNPDNHLEYPFQYILNAYETKNPLPPWRYFISECYSLFLLAVLLPINLTLFFGVEIVIEEM
jgi:hypothetical protein